MNVLLTTVSGRSHFVDFWRTALGDRGRVLAADASGLAPALQRAHEAFVVPRFNDPAYVDAILQICVQHDVRLLVPATDAELPVIDARRADLLAVGTVPVVSDRAVLDVCLDKLAMHGFLVEHGLDAPTTLVTLADARQSVAAGDLSFPLVVKPRWGSGSLLLSFPTDDAELELSARLTERVLARTRLAGGATEAGRTVLFQPRIPGDEYGLDVVNDLDGRYVGTLVRRKLKMSGGRTEQAVTMSHPGLERLGATLGRALGHRGVLDCDVMVDGGRCLVIDLNARFGGGYAFSHLAGADVPSAMLAWATDAPVDPSWLTVREGTVVAMSHDPVVLRELPGSMLGVTEPVADDSVSPDGR